MANNSREVEVEKLPPCDFCEQVNGPKLATYDGKTKSGSWAYMCEQHFKEHGVGLGLGKGQRLKIEQ